MRGRIKDEGEYEEMERRMNKLWDLIKEEEL